MRLYAFIQDGKIVNLSESDEPLDEQEWPGYDFVVDVTDVVPAPQIEWLYDGTNFTEPPPPVIPPPYFVTRYALRRVLFDAGQLDAADAYFTDTPSSPGAAFEWFNRSRLWLDSDLMREYQTFRGWSDTELGDLFSAARYIPD